MNWPESWQPHQLTPLAIETNEAMFVQKAAWRNKNDVEIQLASFGKLTQETGLRAVVLADVPRAGRRSFPLPKV